MSDTCITVIYHAMYGVSDCAVLFFSSKQTIVHYF